MAFPSPFRNGSALGNCETLNFYIHLAQNILLNIFNLDSFLYDVH